MHVHDVAGEPAVCYLHHEGAPSFRVSFHDLLLKNQAAAVSH
jgi:hypothetical protein